ncbi:helix-turn-helix domain-containing protein [Streptomyces sp. NPDC088745]|uniref:helix-turn-helix domain-containing protein n=1 Tax=Streptomyces sp. NPDC088745 TaxID=3365884 RepID=UPI0037FC40D8
MDARTRPTGRRIALGSELRELRHTRKLTLEEAAQGLGFSEAQLQRVETGLSSLRRRDHLVKLLERYGVTDRKTVNELLEMQAQASDEDWFIPYKDSSTPAQMPRFVQVEAVARSVRAYHPLLPWGYLQTEAYARAIFAMQQPVLELPRDSIDKAVRLRMLRQKYITRDEEPMMFHAILGEPALRHIVGDIDVMVEQGEALIKLNERENVTIQFLPSNKHVYRFAGDFTILGMPENLPDQVQVDSAMGDLSMSGKPRTVGNFNRRFELLTAAALPPEETPEFIRTITQEMAKK